MRNVVLETGYEAVPEIKRKSPWKITCVALVAIFYALICWTLLGRGMAVDGPERTDKFADMATVKSCDETGPLSFAGIGYYWVCEIEVRPYSSSFRQEVVAARSYPDELTPADIGKSVRVRELGNYYARDYEGTIPWWSYVPMVAGLVAVPLFAYGRQRKRFQKPTSEQPAAAALSLAVLRPLSGAVSAPDLPETASRTVIPHDWSSAKFWRICGVFLVIAAIAGIVAFNAARGTELRKATLTIAGIGLLSPLWMRFCTPRWAGKGTWRTTFTVSTKGIRWYRHHKLAFDVGWEDIRELRLTRVTDGKRTMWLVDFFPAGDKFAKRRPELGGLWEIGAKLDSRALPSVEKGYRLPEAFSEAAIEQVRTAMLAIRPDRLSEYAGTVQGGQS